MADKLLTRKECEQVLVSEVGMAFELEDYEISTVTDAHGFLGEYYRLTLHCRESKDFAEDKSFKYFLKSIPLKIAEAGKVLIFRKETELYDTLLKDLQLHSTTQWCPKSYYTRSDILVLQDLCNFGYEKCRHNEESLSGTELKALLGALAVLHASSITIEEQKGLIIEKHYPSNILEEITVAPDIEYFTTGLKTIMDLSKLHRAYQTAKHQEFIAKELETRLASVYEMVNASSKYRNVLCHRDPWRANILFKYMNDSVTSAILVDFQTCRYSPPCIDLLLAIFMNLGIEERKNLEKDYILLYYEKFKSELSRNYIDADKCLPLKELLDSYENLKLFGYIYRLMAATLITVPAEMVTNEYKYVERAKTFLSYLDTNETLRLYVEACIGEMLEYIL